MPSLRQTNKKARGWVFTLNNYDEQDVERLDTLLTSQSNVKYIVFGKEVGEQGTPHLQGYVHFKEACRHASVVRITGAGYCAIREGSLEQAVDYCKKEGNFYEHGELRIRAKENKWSDIIDLAKDGKLDVIEEEYPLIYLMHKPKLESLMSPNLEPIQDDLSNHFEWWYGPTGTGKSRNLWNLYPEHYDKQINKWWDGYLYQEVVAIEEADPKKCEHMAYFFKRWCDHYPFRAEIKNGHLNNIRPNKIIVTSNYSIQECFPNRCDYEPLLRRFKVREFPFVGTVLEPEHDAEATSPPGTPIGEIFQFDEETWNALNLTA